MLCGNLMLDGEFKDGTPRSDAFCQVLENALYPGHLGRLPSRVTKQIIGSQKRAGAMIKADQWKRVIQMLPVALYEAWREDGKDCILDEDMDADLQVEPDMPPTRPVPRRQQTHNARGRQPGQRGGRTTSRARPRRSDESAAANSRPQQTDDSLPFVRNRARWYRVAVSLSAGLRILHAHAISVDDAEAAVDDLSQAAKGILALGGRLTVNWHIVMHYAT